MPYATAEVQELRAIASAEAPVSSILEAGLCPIHFRVFLATEGKTHHLIVQGEATLPDDTVLEVTCHHSPHGRLSERELLRAVPMPVLSGAFAGVLMTTGARPAPGLYAVHVRYRPQSQPVPLRSNLDEAEEWTLSAEIALDTPEPSGGRGTSVRERRLAWQIETLAVELARIQDQFEIASRVLDEARTPAQLESWRLECVLLHDLAVLYGRRLAEKEALLEEIRKERME